MKARISIKSQSKSKNNPKPPKAKKQATVFEKFGDKRVDNYFWLNQKENPKVVEHLNKENEYTDAVMAPFQNLKGQIFEELKSRIAKDDTSVPYYSNGYWYSVKVEGDKDYAIYYRKQGDNDDFAATQSKAKEELLLDMNSIAEGLDCCILGQPRVSPDNAKLIYGIDTKGNRLYSLYLKDLASGEVRSLNINNVSGSATWSSDSKSIIYCVKHPQTLRNYQVYIKDLYSDKPPILIFEELNESFELGVFTTTSKKFIVIQSEQFNVSSECYFISSENVLEKPKLFSQRRDRVEYEIDHVKNTWFIKHNNNAHNFKISFCKDEISDCDLKNWQTLIEHRLDTYIEGFCVNNYFIAINKRQECLEKIALFEINFDSSQMLGKDHDHFFRHCTGSVGIGVNTDPDAKYLRFNMSSLTQPYATYDYFIDGRTTMKRKQMPVPNYDPQKYKEWTEFATAQDGTKIPISLVVSKDRIFSNETPKLPTLLYGYGAYGLSSDPSFTSNIFSLVDRGIIFAIAHIRGGQEGGRDWYEQGKMHNKINTFTDFIACADHLINIGVSDRESIGAYGGSAGGLLMGAVMNMRPELFKFVIAQVPFVDLMTTMQDESLPLTVGEYTEWGNPNIKSDYWYMRRYSPYDNVQKKAYPYIYVSTGINDSQVQYFEPAKWVQKLREYKTDKNKILMRCQMGAGHGGKSGRFKSLEDVAERYAFVIATIEGKI